MRYLLVLALLASTAHADDGEVLTPVEHREPPVLVQPPAGAKTHAVIATVVAGGFIVAAGFSYMWAQHEASKLDEISLQTIKANDESRAAVSAADRWHTASYWLAAGSLVSVGIAGYLWTRSQPRFVPAVEATAHGGTVGLAGSF
jgi:hypothetical protein